MNRLRGTIMGVISSPIIERVTVMMNSKENRHMRLSVFNELERTWLIEAVRAGLAQPGLEDYLSGQPIKPRRRVLFIRLSQTLRELLATIPRWRLLELAARANQHLPDVLPPIQDLLRVLGVELGPALEIHRTMGGDVRIDQLNRVGTHFTALRPEDIESLSAHACWQAHAMRALFWD